MKHKVVQQTFIRVFQDPLYFLILNFNIKIYILEQELNSQR